MEESSNKTLHEPWNKGKLVSAEGVIQAEGNLGHPRAIASENASPET